MRNKEVTNLLLTKILKSIRIRDTNQMKSENCWVSEDNNSSVSDIKPKVYGYQPSQDEEDFVVHDAFENWST